jgi:hypothetical protein
MEAASFYGVYGIKDTARVLRRARQDFKENLFKTSSDFGF